MNKIKEMKQAFTLLSLAFILACHGQSGTLGRGKWTVQDLFSPGPGNIFVTDTQTVNNWQRAWAQEPTIFLDSADNLVKCYFTGGADSLGTVAYNNKLGVSTTTNFTTWSTPQKLIGQGLGAPANRRVTSSWVGKSNGKYYCLGLNGYGIGWPGEDREVYGYTSTDGINWTDQGKKMNKATAYSGGAVNGFGNTAIVVDEHNKPLTFGGKTIGLIEAWYAGFWQTFRGETDSLMGTWTLTHLLPSLQVNGSGMFGGNCVIYKNGVYHNFYHYSYNGGNSNTYLAYATSTDMINWTIVEAPFRNYATLPYGGNTDQIADPYVVEIGGKTYMVAEIAQNNPTYKSQMRLWTFDGTFDKMVRQVKGGY